MKIINVCRSFNIYVLICSTLPPLLGLQLIIVTLIARLYYLKLSIMDLIWVCSADPWIFSHPLELTAIEYKCYFFIFTSVLFPDFISLFTLCFDYIATTLVDRPFSTKFLLHDVKLAGTMCSGYSMLLIVSSRWHRSFRESMSHIF